MRDKQGIAERVRTRLPVMVAIAVAVAAAVAFRQMSPGAAIAVAVAAAAVGIAFPARSGEPRGETATQALEASEDRALNRLADALPEPVLILDRRRSVLHRNAAAAQAFPSTRVGDPIAFSFRQPALLTALETAMDGPPTRADLQIVVPTETWYRADIARLRDDGGPARVVLLLHNLTEQRRIEQLRGDFIANASHELRTPLTSVIGLIDTLMGPAARDAAAREKFLPVMRQQAERMSRLIDDLLSLSRIEMRQHLRPTGKVDLKLLLREVREGLASQIADAGGGIEMAMPEEPAIVTGDRNELYEVFENLLDNAIKYGAEGGPVAVTLAPSPKPAFAFSVVVQDRGPGVDPAQVPRLTERFYRVDAESSRKKKGTGLGLAIVKHLVNRHRGELAISSTRGQGLRVEILLPE